MASGTDTAREIRSLRWRRARRVASESRADRLLKRVNGLIGAGRCFPGLRARFLQALAAGRLGRVFGADVHGDAPVQEEPLRLVLRVLHRAHRGEHVVVAVDAHGRLVLEDVVGLLRLGYFVDPVAGTARDVVESGPAHRVPAGGLPAQDLGQQQLVDLRGLLPQPGLRLALPRRLRGAARHLERAVDAETCTGQPGRCADQRRYVVSHAKQRRPWPCRHRCAAPMSEYYNPMPFIGLSRHPSAARAYSLTCGLVLDQRPCAATCAVGTPRRAASVGPPARSPCAVYAAALGSSAFAASLRTASLIAVGVIDSPIRAPPWVTARSSRPEVMPRRRRHSIQARATRTGSVSGCEPGGSWTVAPTDSVSVFEVRIERTRPSSVKATSVMFSAASSERRSIPAKPSTTMTRSRSPAAVVVSQASVIARSGPRVTGGACLFFLPASARSRRWVRRISRAAVVSG